MINNKCHTLNILLRIIQYIINLRDCCNSLIKIQIVCNASPSYTQNSMHPNCLHDNSNITGNWAIVCIYFNIIVTRSRGTTGDVTQHQFVRHYISIHIPGNWYNCNGLSDWLIVNILHGWFELLDVNGCQRSSLYDQYSFWRRQSKDRTETYILNNNKPQRTTNQTGDGGFYTILQSFIHCNEHRALTYAFNLFFASRDAKNRSVKAIIERGDSV